MELFELDINALSKGKKEAFFILYHLPFIKIGQRFILSALYYYNIVLFT